VAAAFLDVHFDRQPLRAERIRKELALAERYERISIAVDDQERWVVLADPGDRVETLHYIQPFLYRSAEESLDELPFRIELDSARFFSKAKEIGRPAHVADCLHSARDLEVFAHVEVLHVSAGTHQCDEVSTGADTERADPVGINSILGCMHPKPADRGLAILDLRRENGVLTQPIADARGREALRRERQREALRFIAALPAAAMDPDHERELVALVRHVKIELLSFVTASDIGKIPMSGDRGWHRQELRLQSLAKEQRGEEERTHPQWENRSGEL